MTSSVHPNTVSRLLLLSNQPSRKGPEKVQNNGNNSICISPTKLYLLFSLAHRICAGGVGVQQVFLLFMLDLVRNLHTGSLPSLRGLQCLCHTWSQLVPICSQDRVYGFHGMQNIEQLFLFFPVAPRLWFSVTFMIDSDPSICRMLPNVALNLLICQLA